jgi:hypothetical protein
VERKGNSTDEGLKERRSGYGRNPGELVSIDDVVRNAIDCEVGAYSQVFPAIILAHGIGFWELVATKETPFADEQGQKVRGMTE